MVVVFPAPLGPRNPKKSPASTRSDMPSTAVKLPYRLTTFVRVSAGAPAAVAGVGDPFRE